jgi:hypothetical protein
LSNVSYRIDESTEKAIAFKIGHEFNELRSTIHRYIVEQTAAANSQGLALHRGYQHLQQNLVPEMLERVITYCLDLEVTHADFITLKIRTAFQGPLKALGQSLGVSFQSPATVGMTMHAILSFNGWVDAYCSGIPSRVHVAVEKRRHMVQPRPSEFDEKKTVINFSGPTQINNNSPGSTQNTSDSVPAQAPTQAPQSKVERFSWVVTIVVGILAVPAAIVGIVQLLRHQAPSLPSARAEAVVPTHNTSVTAAPTASSPPQVNTAPANVLSPSASSSQRRGTSRASAPASEKDRLVSERGKLILRAVDSKKKPLPATCAVDGVAVLPPYEATMPLGRVSASCRLEDYNDGFAEGQIRANQTTTLTVELKDGLGALTVKVEDADGNPIAGKCVLDGQAFEAAANGSTTRLRLPARKMRLDCTADGYEEEGGDVAIEGGLFRTATLKLRKLRPH